MEMSTSPFIVLILFMWHSSLTLHKCDLKKDPFLEKTNISYDKIHLPIHKYF